MGHWCKGLSDNRRSISKPKTIVSWNIKADSASCCKVGYLKLHVLKGLHYLMVTQRSMTGFSSVNHYQPARVIPDHILATSDRVWLANFRCMFGGVRYNSNWNWSISFGPDIIVQSC